MSEMAGELTESAVRGAREVRVGLSRLRRRLRETQDRADLTPSQSSVLSRLDKQGPATAAALAAAERVRPQSVATTLAALTEHGLVERRPDPTDGRRQLVSLSAAGRELVADRRRTGQEWLSRALQEHLTEPERHTVIEAFALLERISSS